MFLAKLFFKWNIGNNAIIFMLVTIVSAASTTCDSEKIYWKTQIEHELKDNNHETEKRKRHHIQFYEFNYIDVIELMSRPGTQAQQFTIVKELWDSHKLESFELITSSTTHKFAQRTWRCIFLGYSFGKKVGHCMTLIHIMLCVSRCEVCWR